MEIILLNKPGLFRDYLLKALKAGDRNTLRSLKNNQDKERLVFLNSLQDLKKYHYSASDCLILSAAVMDRLETGWIRSVLNGSPIKPPFGFVPTMTEDDILRIHAELEAEY